jgi:nucleoside-diphosphate-sugar epimerase
MKEFETYCSEWAGRKVIFNLPSVTERKGYSVAMQAILDNQRLRNLGWKANYRIQQAINRTIDILNSGHDWN